MRKNSRHFKTVLIACCCWMLTLSLTGCAKREIVNADSKGQTIVCFGDSITFGYGAAEGEDYPTVLAKMTRYSIINAGIDGDTSSEATRRIKTDVLEREPFLVIIELGANDFLRQLPLDVTLGNMKKMIDEIQARGAMVAVMDVSAGPILGQYHKVFYQLAQEKGAIFIPSILNGIITNPHFKSDFIHPNADGYKVIAQRVYRTILPYLNQNTLIKRYGK